MENLILGLLMITQMAAYELHTHIKANYQGIVAPSLGNVQRALKKLEEKGYVTKQEVQSGKVAKKIFTITKTGRTHFMTWLNNPLDLAKVNNPEMGRLLLLGMLTREQQLANIELVIADLREAWEYLQAVEASMMTQFAAAEEQGGLDYLHQQMHEENPEFYDELLAIVGAPSVSQFLKNVNEFGYYTLQHGIAETKFNLEWFTNLRNKLTEKSQTR